jgi:cytochrome c2
MHKHIGRFVAIWIALAAVFWGVLPALAGGWAVITVDNLPKSAQPGEPILIRFTVLQHGNNPLDDLYPTLQAWSAEGGPRLTFEAHSTSDPGVYEAELVLPAAGTWNWSIQAFNANQPMPAISVAKNTQVAPINSIAGKNLALAAGLAAVVLAILAIWLRRGPADRLVPAILSAAILVGALAILAGGQASTREAQVAAAQSSTRSTVSYGSALFTAKGCITCHNHESAAIQADFPVNIGPDLSHYAGNPDFLQSWLQDPKAIKPDTPMPNLHLKQAEIEALIAFLNQSTSQ